MGMGTAAGFGAGEGADMLQRILLRVAQEEQARERAKAEQQRIALTSRGQDIDMRGQDFSREASQGNLALGNRNAATAEARTAEDVRQFDALAPVRASNIRLQGAQATDIEGRPGQRQQEQDFALARLGAEGTQRMREIGAQGQNAFRLQNARLAAEAGPAGVTAAQTTKDEANAIVDAHRLAKELRADPALGSVTGPVSEFVNSINIPGTDIHPGRALHGSWPSDLARVESKRDQLAGFAELAASGQMKGQGQITEFERRLLASAASRLRSKGLSDTEYAKAVQEVEEFFARKAADRGISLQGNSESPMRPERTGAAPRDPLGIR